MKFSLAAILFGVALWGATGGTAQAQTFLVRPDSGANQKPGINPFQYGQWNNAGGYGNNYGGAAGYGGTQFIDPMQLQMQRQNFAAQAAAQTSTGLPPFSTLPPPRYFANFQPYYPLMGAGGYSNTPSYAAAPR